jgi:restriction endonuclease Mrr
MRITEGGHVSKKAKGQAEFVRWMGPLLDCLRAVGGSAKPKEVSAWIARELKLAPAITESDLKSGANRFHNQVQWARQYLVWQGLIDDSRRGVWTLTPLGWKASNVVGRRDVGEFRNALLGRAEKGVFITTGRFTPDAETEAARDGVIPIELIDGERLVELFQLAQLGVKPKQTFVIDYAFFDEFRRQ